jgi:hypothetical protein
MMLDSEMNDRKSTPPQGSGQPPVVGAPVSLSRRRFTRGAAPVLLGTLASKPVLGAEYICTVSGHTSGNASAHLTVGVNCAAGYSVAHWASDTSVWPSPIDKGFLPNQPNCKFNSSGANANPQGKIFNGYGGLFATFYYETGSNTGCDVLISTVGTAPASMFQVLKSTDPTDLFVLGRETIASLLNTLQFPGTYPLSQARVIAMFNAVQPTNGTYLVEGANLRLTRAGVIDYFQKINALA